MAIPELQHVNDSLDDVRFVCVVRAFDAEVCLRVNGFAFLEHDLDLGEAFLVTQVREQRTRVLAPDALGKDFGTCPQADDGPGFADDLEVLGLVQRTAAKRDDLRGFVACDFGDHVAFHLAESGLAVLGENVRDALACAFDNHGIGVDVRPAEAFCQGPSGAALAASHETSEKNMSPHTNPASLCA